MEGMSRRRQWAVMWRRVWLVWMLLLLLPVVVVVVVVVAGLFGALVVGHVCIPRARRQDQVWTSMLQRGSRGGSQQAEVGGDKEGGRSM